MSQISLVSSPRKLCKVIPTLWILCFAGSLRAAPPAVIEKSLLSAKTWLYSKQSDNGSWEVAAAPEKVTDAVSSREPKAGQFTGRTALAVLALLNSGDNSSDPRIKKAVDFVLKNKTTGVYALGLRCQMWLALPKSPQTLQAMRDDAKILMSSAKQSGNGRGMYDYTPGASKMYSHSRSQYAVLGLWAAGQMGAEIPDAYWKTAEEAWKRNQSSDGGWTYTHPSETPFTSSPGMTTVGIASLFIIHEQLHGGEGIGCHGNEANPAIDKGIAWLAAHMDLFATGNTYSRYFPFATLYAYERVGAASGLRYFGNVDWFEKGADFALHKQSDDGSWAWGASDVFDAHVNTCCAMLFLAKGRAPIVVSKLQYFDGDSKKEVKWNQRPRDAANVVRFVGRMVERELAFQIVTLDAPLEDLTESPILYIAGSEAVKLSEPQKQKLKAYIEAGGMVLANADCGSEAFTASIKKLGTELFPAYEFGELPQDSLIYTSYYPRSKWKVKPSVQSLTNGVRQLMVLIPQADVGKIWQLQDSRSRPECFDLAADLLLYAVDQTNLRFRGEGYYLPDQPATKVGKTLTIGRAKYNGAWDPEPGGWRRLTQFLGNKRIGLTVVPLELGKNQLGEAKLLHLTGAEEHKLSDGERAELIQFVTNGGTLVIDAAGGQQSVCDFHRKPIRRNVSHRQADADSNRPSPVLGRRWCEGRNHVSELCRPQRRRSNDRAAAARYYGQRPLGRDL